MNNQSDGRSWLKCSERVSAAARIVTVIALVLLCLAASAQNIQPIYAFPESPATPFAGLVQGQDGNFYGTTWAGGSNGAGAVIKVAPNGAWSTLYSFSPAVANAGEFDTNPDGEQPWAALTLGPDGNYYGTTWNGGNAGQGTVFKVTTNGVLTTLVKFAGTNGANPEAGLTLGPDGNLYGTTSAGGSSGNGTVFQVTTNGVLTVLHSFVSTSYHFNGSSGYYTNIDGADPVGSLVLGPNGILYGSTSSGGTNGSGALFEVTTNGSWTNLYAFSVLNYNDSGLGATETNFDGANPAAALTLGSDGNFYGTTDGGGKSGSGTVFKVTPDGALSTLYTFAAGRYIFSDEKNYYSNFDGAFPDAALVQGLNGNFYGSTIGGGTNGLGTLFEITTGGVLTKLLTFTYGDGAAPRGALALGANDTFYGTTEGGGSSGNGTVFEMTADGTLTTLISFANANGASPYAGLALAPNGIFYGTTYDGGTNGAGVQVEADGYGTVFEIATNGSLTTLANFAGTNGENPEAPLTLGPGGNFYGTTYSGGSNDFGSIFEITAGGVLTTLASFAGTNGQNPTAGLVPGTNGNLYGTTVNGGADESGAIFEVTTGGVLTLLYSFTGGNDGMAPYGGLTLGTNGNFFGTCAYGGADYDGTVFEITNGGGFTLLHTFTDGSDGASPFAGLTLGPDGNFYGTTTTGNNGGTYGGVFKMTPNGALTNLYTFTGGSNSGSPNGLTLGPDGNFYGTTYGGTVAGDFGTVFQVTPGGAFTSLVSFAATNGDASKGDLTLGPDGNFYGTTSYGGAQQIGQIYRLDLPPEIIQQSPSQFTTNGAHVTLSVTLFGTAPYSFQWLSNNIPIVGATNSVLTLPDFTADNAADYSVSVSNSWGGVTSAGALLAAGNGPMISRITLSANGNATLECQGLPNMTSRLWATTNLATQANWTPIFTNSATSSEGAWQYTDTNGSFQQRYYRLSMP